MRRRLLVIVPLLGATLAINGLGAVAHALPLPVSIFPNDSFTVADASQLTGRRVNMAMTNCAVEVSNCNEIALINALDGFDLDPDVKVRFSGPIDVFNGQCTISNGNPLSCGAPNGILPGVITCLPNNCTIRVCIQGQDGGC